MDILANRVGFFDSSAFREAIQRQQNLDNPIDLSVGLPEELTPAHVKAAGIKAIQEDKTQYTPANGIKELRQALARKLQRENGINATPDTVTVVPGLTTGQLLIYLAILNPGDEVIVLDPYYPPYVHLAEAVGAHVQTVSTLPNYQPDVDAIEAAITHRTKAIMINSPNNPTGAMYSLPTLQAIARIADKHNILVISDEIYEHFAFDTKHYSMGSLYENTITMMGFSKEHAMTGWRLGYMTGPHFLIDAINELQQYAVFASSTIAQHAAVAALSEKRDIKDKYEQKRNFLKKELLDMGYKIHGMQGAYYTFLKAPFDMTDLEFINKAADHNLVVVAGRAFSGRHGYFRISYGAPMHVLERGVEVLKTISQNE